MREDIRQDPVSGKENTQEVKAFFDSWALYKKVAGNNYLSHREVYRCLEDFLNTVFAAPFSMLDLGCGDACFMAGALRQTRAAFYQGVDISQEALRLAEENIKPLNIPAVFKNADFLEAVKNADFIPGIIWIGLSLHHLSHPQKIDFIKACHRRLKNGGYFMIFDPVLEEGESREDFVARWWDICSRLWSAVTAAEKESILRHVQDADFPESMSFYRRTGLENGFKEVNSVFQDESGIYRIVCFKA